MKTRIKTIVSLATAFFIVSVVFKDSRSPVELANNLRQLGSQNSYIAKIFNLKSTLNSISTVAVTLDPIVKRTEAKEKKTVFYKGKKLELLVDYLDSEIPEPILEYFYQLELKKEKQGGQ